MTLTNFETHPLSETNLFQPLSVGATSLDHRIVMAPLTRFRASDDFVPTAAMVDYYSQRAQYPGTLIISEATFISLKAGGFPNVPGLWNDAQVSEWKKIVDAVHNRKSKFFFQLWSLGRQAEPGELAKHNLPFVTSTPEYWCNEVEQEATVAKNPLRALTKEEIQEYINDYVHAAKNAMAAGADGVEIHNANGYLLHQFLDPLINKRTDEYGGSIENRTRFTLQVVDALIQAIGADRVAIRLSPFHFVRGFSGKHPLALAQHAYLLAELESRARNGQKLAYVHIVEPRNHSTDDLEIVGDNTFVSTVWSGPIIRAGNYGAHPDVAIDHAKNDRTLIAYGRYFISNPDLVSRLEKGFPLNVYDRDTFYEGGLNGYTDYPEFQGA